MGLDISHYKATLDPLSLMETFKYKEYILERDFIYFDTTIQYFMPYLQKIKVPTVLVNLIFPKLGAQIDFKSEYEEPSIVMEGIGPKEFQLYVDAYIQKNKLSQALMRRYEMDDYWLFEFSTFEKKLGFYYDQVGYQRKGMNGMFSDRFCNNDIYNYTQRKDFNFALSCVDFYWQSDTQEMVENRKMQFKKEFVDAYEDRRSWMNVSY